MKRTENGAQSEGRCRPVRRVAVIGNHSPRQCGIATFTADLIEAISERYQPVDCFAVALDDRPEGYDYPVRVRYAIQADTLDAYRRGADFIKASGVDVVCLQHEYGIFGGPAGNHVLSLLRALHLPLVTTLHTVLHDPDPQQRAVMDELITLSDRLVVMSQKGAQFLEEVHGVDPAQIDIIHHGIHPIPTLDPTADRIDFGMTGKSVLLTFGLLSPDKGIENVIAALPAILDRFPEAVYVVLGATHPQIRKHQGEAYRESLETLAERLGVRDSVHFHNRFVSLDELTRFLRVADIYLTPYIKAEQITSGTLAYAVGSGKAVLSTPYYYAQELLADGRGILIPWQDPDAIAREVTHLLAEPAVCQALQRRAAEYGREMAWPAVAEGYMDCFKRARVTHADRALGRVAARAPAPLPDDLPPIQLDHLRAMTDDTGLLQHATYNVPHRAEGYCVDDNARALLLMTLLEGDAPDVRALTTRYLAFVLHALHPQSGRFRNFLSYDRTWLEEVGSEDSHGRTLWALGTVLGRSRDPAWRRLAEHLWRAALPAVASFTSPRAWAYTLLGMDEALQGPTDRTVTVPLRELLAHRLLQRFQEYSTPEWPWLEDRITYANARLSQALLVSGRGLRSEGMVWHGLTSLTWLASVQCSAEGWFTPVGSEGFYPRGDVPAGYDQQCIEACGMVSACQVSFQITGEVQWLQEARRAFAWFTGQNALQQSLYDPATGGCCDGIHPGRLNENQGAESTLSFLQALMEMRSAKQTMAIATLVPWKPPRVDLLLGAGRAARRA